MTIRLAVIEFHTSFTCTMEEFPRERGFKLVETYETSDGMRSRLCDGLFKTKEEAESEGRRRMKELKGR